MRRPASILLICAFSYLLTANVFLHADTTSQAAPFVRALEARYHSAKTFQAVFLERYSDSRTGIQVESGVVYFSRPGRMRWEYESPERKLFVADGKTVWFFVPSDRTVTRAPMKESADWRTPLALLTGKAKLSQLCAAIDLVDAPSSTPGHVVLRCRPRGEKGPARSKPNDDDANGAIATPSAPFDQVLLEVDAATGELADVHVLQPGGVEIEYRFGNWKEDVPLEDSLFHFQAPAGVAVLDDSAASGADPNIK